MTQFYKQKDKNYFYLVYRSILSHFQNMKTALYKLEVLDNERSSTQKSKFSDSWKLYIAL